MFFIIPNTSTCLICFIFLFMNPLITTASSHLSNETDRQALLAIRALIPGDPLNVFSSWNRSAHFCMWQGVTCSPRHHRVTMINLASLGLVGSLSPHIGNLTFLRAINLKNNSFHGQIPQEIGRLFRLKDFRLLNNSFSGEFPSNLTRCPDMRRIHLYKNNLTGKLPTNIASLQRLLFLNLADNQFSGTIPSSFGNLSSLRKLYLADNNLQGSIPLQISHLLKLEILQLSYSNLSSTVPASIFNLSYIELFSLAGNSFQGSLPSDLGLTLPKLEGFYLGGNQFSGHFPSSIANASELIEIDIGSNSFTGPLPMNLRNLHTLQLLSFSYNLFGSNEGNNLMEFLHSLSNCSNIYLLNLAYNGFKGQLSNSIANFSNTKLNRLFLSANYITGNIPFEIGSLTNLIELDLNENVLTGGIPDTIAKLSKLQTLFVSQNNISSQIPSSIGNMSQLNTLAIQYNLLEGNIPDSLGRCNKLQIIDLEYNLLNGSIPEQIFSPPFLSQLFLNNNNLSGLLPLQVGNLKNLRLLSVTENKLSGEIPATLGGCQVLEFLYMQGNLFEGTFPESFKQLEGIQVLDLSRNNLSGKIPSYLGELTSLQSLNLSYNMFDGEVPNKGVFQNITAFSVLGNDKLCGGIGALQLPPCPKVDEEKRKSFNARVIIPLATSSTIVVLSFCLVAIICIRRSRKKNSISTSKEKYPKLSYAELLQATNRFSLANLVGEGRYGSVYKGILNSNKQIVAVKVLNLQVHGASKSFLAECEALRTIRHRNLVKIITSCSSTDFTGGDFKALVFEYMSNGSLESWLHPSHAEEQESRNLSILQRLNIAIDVASALVYLHHHCDTAIVHCDLKPSNILLDDDFCAHVSDFGLSRILSPAAGISNHQQSSSIAIKGTVGYVAPEYGMGCELSIEGDMYSYGVLILEMFSAKRPTSTMFEDGMNIHNYVKESIPQKVMDIVDPRISSEVEDEQNRMRQYGRIITNSKVEISLASILQIGVLCSVELPSERMSASDVINELHKIRNTFLG